MAEYETLAALLEQSDLFCEQAATLRALEDQREQNELVISVVGQFKRGKSSLLNAVLGEPLLPVAITPLTAVVTEIRQGEPRAQVCFRDGSAQEIALGELSDYCGEKGNPHHQKGVRLVRLWTPCQPFGPGTVLVDTPGVGSTNQDNTRETMDYLIHSDAVIFVLSVDSPVHETELQFLRDIRQYAPNLWLVVNKADLAAGEDLTEFLTYCGGVLTEELGREAALCAVSAKTGDGIVDLKENLCRDLQERRGQLQADSIHQKRQLVLRQIRALLSVAEQAAAEPPEELQRKRYHLSQRRQALAEDSATLDVLARHHTEQLVAGIEEELRGQLGTLKHEAQRQGETLAGELQALPLNEFKRTYQDRLEALLREQLEELNSQGMARLEVGVTQAAQALTARADETEEMLAAILREEFQVDYPLRTEAFQVSAREDFYLRPELRRMPRLAGELKDHLLPRKTAQRRFLQQCQTYAGETLECNVNNMIYNYRYKMQESLRPLCRTLEGRAAKVDGALERLIALLEERLASAERSGQERMEHLAQIRQMVEALSEE